MGRVWILLVVCGLLSGPGGAASSHVAGGSIDARRLLEQMRMMSPLMRVNGLQDVSPEQMAPYLRQFSTNYVRQGLHNENLTPEQLSSEMGHFLAHAYNSDFMGRPQDGTNSLVNEIVPPEQILFSRSPRGGISDRPQRILSPEQHPGMQFSHPSQNVPNQLEERRPANSIPSCTGVEQHDMCSTEGYKCQTDFREEGFYICVQGIWTLMFCAPGTYFHPGTQECEGNNEIDERAVSPSVRTPVAVDRPRKTLPASSVIPSIGRLQPPVPVHVLLPQARELAMYLRSLQPALPSIEPLDRIDMASSYLDPTEGEGSEENADEEIGRINASCKSGTYRPNAEDDTFYEECVQGGPNMRYWLKRQCPPGTVAKQVPATDLPCDFTGTAWQAPPEGADVEESGSHQEHTLHDSYHQGTPGGHVSSDVVSNINTARKFVRWIFRNSTREWRPSVDTTPNPNRERPITEALSTPESVHVQMQGNALSMPTMSAPVSGKMYTTVTPFLSTEHTNRYAMDQTTFTVSTHTGTEPMREHRVTQPTTTEFTTTNPPKVTLMMETTTTGPTESTTTPSASAPPSIAKHSPVSDDRQASAGLALLVTVARPTTPFRYFPSGVLQGKLRTQPPVDSGDILGGAKDAVTPDGNDIPTKDADNEVIGEEMPHNNENATYVEQDTEKAEEKDKEGVPELVSPEVKKGALMAAISGDLMGAQNVDFDFFSMVGQPTLKQGAKADGSGLSFQLPLGFEMQDVMLWPGNIISEGTEKQNSAFESEPASHLEISIPELYGNQDE